jgi:hypothetical protein
MNVRKWRSVDGIVRKRRRAHELAAEGLRALRIV